MPRRDREGIPVRVGFGFRFLETAGLKDKAGQAT